MSSIINSPYGENIAMGNKETLETSHYDWVFRKEAYAYSKQSIVGALSGIEPIAPNFYPVATDLYNWLNRIEKNMKVLLEKPKDPEFFILEPYINNPFSFNASTLANMTAQAINESLALARIPETLTPSKCRNITYTSL